MNSLKIQKYLLNRKVFIFLLFIIFYIAALGLWGYSSYYGYPILEMPALIIFVFIIFSIIILTIIYKPRYFAITAFIISLVCVPYTTRVTYNIFNRLRLALISENIVPNYGEYITWGASGFVTGATEFYLVHVSKDDSSTIEKLKRKIGGSGVINGSLLLSTERLDEKYVIFILHF